MGFLLEWYQFLGEYFVIYETFFSSYSIIEINIYREYELFNHNEEYNLFFDHLVALVAESIAQIPVSGNLIPKMTHKDVLLN